MKLKHSIPIRACCGIALLLAAAPALADDATPRFEVELEGGAVWQTRNDVQIPNTDQGTRFALDDVVGTGPWPSGRLYLTWNITPRHGLRLLAAPLTLSETAALPSEVRFEGETFAPGTPTEATYQFNSWRLTYHYRFHDGARWTGWVGFTAKIRDARIELEQPGVSAKKTDLGFVPLLHLRGAARLAQGWRLELDADALAGGPGRAVDAALKVYADVGERWSVGAGYRTVEGGADVEEVYNFAWLHYAVVSLRARL